MTLFECLQKLWTRAQSEGISVCYVQKRHPWESGRYRPPNPVVVQLGGTPGGAMIDICREVVPEREDRPDDHGPANDLWTLAHEYGHHLCPPEEKDAATLCRANQILFHDATRRLSDEEQTLFMTHEERAWRKGREVLTELGLEDLNDFDRCANETQATYRENIDQLPREAPP